MTDVDGSLEPAPGTGRDRGPGDAFADHPSILARLCPFVRTEQGWRSLTPTTGHRCTAVTPPARVASEKQARLCLTAGHVECATYLAAGDVRIARGLPDASVRRPLARTAPVVVERTRARLPADLDVRSGRWGQAALIILMLVALAAVVVARSGDRPAGPAGGSGTGPQDGSVAASASATAAATASEGAPSNGTGSAPATVVGSPSSAPPSSAGALAYTVQKGDTLSGIAARFGTTVAALQKANRISSPGTIRVGQVLTIP